MKNPFTFLQITVRTVWRCGEELAIITGLKAKPEPLAPGWWQQDDAQHLLRTSHRHRAE